jgi:lipopolysaccharide biosynthesis protein
MNISSLREVVNALENKDFNYSWNTIKDIIDYLDDIFSNDESVTTLEEDYRWSLLKNIVKFNLGTKNEN